MVSEFMLQQTPVARVIPRLAEWLERWPTPADLAAVPPGEAVRAWDSIGYPRRALNLHGAAVAITELHGGEVPNDVDSLLAMPGVGPSVEGASDPLRIVLGVRAFPARAVVGVTTGRRQPDRRDGLARRPKPTYAAARSSAG